MLVCNKRPDVIFLIALQDRDKKRKIKPNCVLVLSKKTEVKLRILTVYKRWKLLCFFFFFFLKIRFLWSNEYIIKRSMMFSGRSPATPSTRTTLRQWYRRTLRPTSSPVLQTPTRLTRLARPMRQMRANQSSTCRIRTFWTPVRRMVRADASCGPARLARRKRSPSIEGKPPLCARDGAWERSVPLILKMHFHPARIPFISLIIVYISYPARIPFISLFFYFRQNFKNLDELIILIFFKNCKYIFKIDGVDCNIWCASVYRISHLVNLRTLLFWLVCNYLKHAARESCFRSKQPQRERADGKKTSAKWSRLSAVSLDDSNDEWCFENGTSILNLTVIWNSTLQRWLYEELINFKRNSLFLLHM